MKAVLGPWFWVNKQINTHHKMLNPYRKKKKKFLCHICCKNVPLWQSHPKCSWRWQFIKADILTIRPTTPINWEISAAPLLSLPAQLWSLIPSHMSFPGIFLFLSSYCICQSTEGRITQTTPFTSYQIEPVLAPHQLSLHLHLISEESLVDWT